MIWVRGIILGVSLFLIGVFVFLVAALRIRGPVIATSGVFSSQAYSIDV